MTTPGAGRRRRASPWTSAADRGRSPSRHPSTWTGIGLNRSNEFGNAEPLTGGGTPNVPPQLFTCLSAAQRSVEALGDVILMGVRLYHPTTGRFLTPDPVPGGSANAYDFCNADPVNCTDLNGTFSFRSLLSAVAIVGEIASFIPGPVGAAAAGISAAQGNTAKAIEMGVNAAAALIGAGPFVRVATGAVKHRPKRRTDCRSSGAACRPGSLGNLPSHIPRGRSIRGEVCPS